MAQQTIGNKQLQTFLNGKVTLYGGDSRDVLRDIADNSIDSCVCDPPYALVSIVKRFGGDGAAAVKVPEGGSGAYARASSGFMGKQWDTGDTAFSVEFWAQVMRVLKPGGHVVAFSGTRTYHRLAVAIEDAGFEIRDQLAWVYGSGFPKSHDVSKGIDKASGVKFDAKPASGVGFMGPEGPGGYNVTKNQLTRSGESTDAAIKWQGWGTALKPAWEPICLARKPLIGTVAANVLEHGTGALNIDGCRVEGENTTTKIRTVGDRSREQYRTGTTVGGNIPTDHGRWPANIVHDGSDEVLAGFPDSKSSGGSGEASQNFTSKNGIYGEFAPKQRANAGGLGDSGSAARFFYTAKADKLDRIGSKHPTVKPVDLMQWLCRMVTPPGGVVLDPFAGSGSTGEAAWREGFSAILIEREEEYQADIAERLRLADKGPRERRAKAIKQVANDNLPLFATPAQAGAA